MWFFLFIFVKNYKQMRKILFLLLCTVSMYSQIPTTGQEQDFDYGIKNNVSPTDDNAPYFTVQNSDNVLGKSNTSTWAKKVYVDNGLDLKKNATSTAVTSTVTLTNNGTTFTLSSFTGVIVNNSTVPATRTIVNFSGAVNVTPLYQLSLLYVDNTGTLQQANGATADLTQLQKVDNIYLARVVYNGGFVIALNLNPSIEYGIDNRFRNLGDKIRNINEGNNIGANGANLQINKGAGTTWRIGSNFANDRKVPDETVDIAAMPIPAGVNAIGYRNGSGGWTYEPFTGSITPTFWDDGTGVKATVANNKFTNHRIYFFNATNTYIVYLGRTEHSTLSAAVLEAEKPNAIVDPATSVASLIGTISVEKSCTALNNTALAAFTQGPRMQGGASSGGTSGTQNLQSTYLNSLQPQITTTSTLGAVDFQRGSASDADYVTRIKNGAGTVTAGFTGNGALTATSYNGYTPESIVNKSDSYTASSSTTYASTKALVDGLSTTNNIKASVIDWTGVGDSITYGVGSTSGSTSYFDIIAGQLPWGSTTKLGYSGATVMPISGRTRFSDIVPLIPAGSDLITVMLGVNDWDNDNPLGDVYETLKKTHAALDETVSFAEAFRFNLENIKYNFPNAKIIVITPTNTKGSWSGLYDLKYYVDIEIAIANFLSIPVINAFENSGIYYNDTIYLNDGLHPNDLGYQLIAKKVLAGIIDTPENRTSNTFSNLRVSDDLTIGGTAPSGSDGKVLFKGFTGVTHGRMEIYPYAGSVPSISVYANGDSVGGGFSYFDASNGRYGFGTKTDNGFDKVQINGSISATTYTGGATLTGTPTAPTATVGTNTTQIATTAFVNATTNSNTVLLTGNQTKAGVLTFSANTTFAKDNGISLTNSGPSSSNAFSVINTSAGLGTYVYNQSSGTGSYVLNEGSGYGLHILNNTGSGDGFVSESFGGSTGRLFVGKLQGVGDVFIVDKNGNVTSNQITANGVIKLKNYTVATLPAGTQGDTAYCTDLLTPTYMATAVGGGSVVWKVFHDGTSWKVD